MGAKNLTFAHRFLSMWGFLASKFEHFDKNFLTLSLSLVPWAQYPLVSMTYFATKREIIDRLKLMEGATDCSPFLVIAPPDAYWTVTSNFHSCNCKIMRIVTMRSEAANTKN